MTKKKKPTNKEMVNAISNLYQIVNKMHQEINAIIGTLDMYIEFNKDTDKFKSFINKTLDAQVEKANKEAQKKDDTQTVVESNKASA